MRIILCAGLFLLMMSSNGAVLATPVGYVNILNGQIPSEAFAIERGGESMLPREAYTVLEDGDTVKPSPGASLLFTPDDASCPVVEIEGVFTASACPGSEAGLKDLAYDYISGEFMAAPLEEVGLFATRGAGGATVFTLPPQALRVFVEPSGLSGALRRSSFIAVASRAEEADALITGTDSSAALANYDGSGVMSLALPADNAKLRRAILGRANLKAMRALTAPGQWPDGLVWTVEVLAASEDGEVEHDGRKWASARTLAVAGPGLADPVDVPEECLLRFSFDNQSAKPYYAYLVNFTDEGQVLLVLPPDSSGRIPNLVPAGQELSLPQISLELGAPVEYVRLIVSERPLDLSQFAQDSLDGPALSGPARVRPVPRDAWQTALAVFQSY
jgi:hypothetical protein